MPLEMQKKRSAGIFVKSTTGHWVNSENKIPVPENFCNLNFQLKHPWTGQSTLAYTKAQQKDPHANTEDSILTVLFSRSSDDKFS